MNDTEMMLPAVQAVDDAAAPLLNADAVDVVAAAEVPAFYSRASMLELKANEQAALLEKFDDADVEIRPDGLIYLPQAFYRERLNAAFGIGQWALIQHRVLQDGNYLYFDGSLYARGVFVARAMGEGQKHATNKMQSWAAVYESAKSDCLVRCCKDLSVGAQLWKPAYSRAWVEAHGVKLWREYTEKEIQKYGKKGEWQWRRKDAAPYWWEKNSKGNGNGSATHTEPHHETNAPEPVPDATAAIKASSMVITREEAAKYVVPLGKKKGQTISALTPDEISAAITHCESKNIEPLFVAHLKVMELPF